MQVDLIEPSVNLLSNGKKLMEEAVEASERGAPLASGDAIHYYNTGLQEHPLVKGRCAGEGRG